MEAGFRAAVAAVAAHPTRPQIGSVNATRTPGHVWVSEYRSRHERRVAVRTIGWCKLIPESREAPLCLELPSNFDLLGVVGTSAIVREESESGQQRILKIALAQARM
jgi:hypothetical protein